MSKNDVVTKYVDVELGGEKHRLLFNMLALVKVEDGFTTLGRLFALHSVGSYKAHLALLEAGLEHEQDKTLTKNKIAAFLTLDSKKDQRIVDKIDEAIMLSMPDAFNKEVLETTEEEKK